MSFLNPEWTPGFGSIVTWLAADKHGNIAVMVNNCWGNVPQAILNIDRADDLLEDQGDYIWGDSKKYLSYQV